MEHPTDCVMNRNSGKSRASGVGNEGWRDGKGDGEMGKEEQRLDSDSNGQASIFAKAGQTT